MKYLLVFLLFLVKINITSQTLKYDNLKNGLDSSYTVYISKDLIEYKVGDTISIKTNDLSKIQIVNSYGDYLKVDSLFDELLIINFRVVGYRYGDIFDCRVKTIDDEIFIYINMEYYISRKELTIIK